MPTLTIKIGPEGPIANLLVGVSAPRMKALQDAGLQVPTHEVIRGLIDTGAGCTCIDSRVIKKLGIEATGNVPIHTPSTGSTAHTANQYDIAISILMDDQHVQPVSVIIPVLECDFSQQNIDALIGRDLLSFGSLFYNGPKNEVTLTI